jgi:hypothetical protein
LRNPELCRTAAVLLDGKHFLDTSRDEQQMIRDLVHEQNEILLQKEQKQKRERRKAWKEQQRNVKLQSRAVLVQPEMER